MLSTKKTNVPTKIQTKLSSIEASTLPRTKPLVMLTTCVKGRKIWTPVCTAKGNVDSGKKVPLKRNMGVTSRNAG